MSPRPLNIAIIGAGIAGLTLALTLSRSANINITIYESQEAPGRTIGGSINIGPNGCTILDKLNLLDEVKTQSFECDIIKFFDSAGNITWEVVVGDKERYGHSSLRARREVVINTLLLAVGVRHIPIICSKKFAKILSESASEGVTFSFADGTSASADILVGADGIHSKVRQQIYPDTAPTFTGSIALGTTVPAESALPTIQGNNAGSVMADKIGIFTGPHGTVFLLPESSSCENFLVGSQVKFPDLPRVELEQLQADRKRMHAILAQDRDGWPEHVRLAIDAASLSEAWWLWPLKLLPSLPSWRSKEKKVVLVADAAHAMMPAAGQGANLALEDCFFLGQVLVAVADGKVQVKSDEALQFWGELRSARVEQVVEVSKGMHKLRETGKEKVDQDELRKILEGGKVGVEKDMGTGNRMQHLDWLFGGISEQEIRVEEWRKMK